MTPTKTTKDTVKNAVSPSSSRSVKSAGTNDKVEKPQKKGSAGKSASAGSSGTTKAAGATTKAAGATTKAAAGTAKATAGAAKAAVSKTSVVKPAPSRNGAAPQGTKAAVSTRTPAKKPGTPKGAKSPTVARGPYADDQKFLDEQRELLLADRAVYLSQASDLKAEADSLAQEREPGDVQFDEESGEGGTVTVDRERDLALSAQAMAAVEEIDAALERIADHTYGACERCHQPIPKPRLKALPFARLCVACKSGGLSRR